MRLIGSLWTTVLQVPNLAGTSAGAGVEEGVDWLFTQLVYP